MLRPTIIFATMIVLGSGLAFGQTEPERAAVPIARLSYRAGHVIDWRQERGNPQICLALYKGGSYDVSRLTENGLETRKGKLSHRDFLHVHNLLRGLDFQSKGSGMVRNDAEVFVAEVNLQDRVVRRIWGNPDGEAPFPSSTDAVVRWLREFKPQGSLPFTRRELSDQPPICPSLSENPLPLISSLRTNQ